jgi:hypothetical protein
MSFIRWRCLEIWRKLWPVNRLVSYFLHSDVLAPTGVGHIYAVHTMEITCGLLLGQICLASYNRFSNKLITCALYLVLNNISENNQVDNCACSLLGTVSHTIY